MSAPTFRDFEREVHDRLAVTYHRAFSPVTRHAIAPLLAAVAPLAARRLLDVATGPGNLAAAAAAHGAHATGLDLSPRMLDVARGLHPDVAFREGDAEHLPFDDGTFDAIVSAFGVGHFPDTAAALTDWMRVLVPGGRIAVSWWDDPARSRVNGVFFEAFGALGVSLPAAIPAGPSAFRYSTPEALTGLLQGAGLAEVVVRTHTATHRMADTAALWDLAVSSYARIGAVIESLDDAGRAALFAAVDERLVPYRVSGGLDIPVAFHVAQGVKPVG
jgi:SAM-dependent methyltransferase